MIDESVIELNLFTDMGKHGVNHQIDLRMAGDEGEHDSDFPLVCLNFAPTALSM